MRQKGLPAPGQAPPCMSSFQSSLQGRDEMVKLTFREEKQSLLMGHLPWAMYHARPSGHTPNPEHLLQGGITPAFQDGEVRSGRC